MREIRFRGKRLGDGKWIYGGYLRDEESHVIANVEFCVSLEPQTVGEIYYRFNGREVDPETVGQFTGLKDMEGQEIYEGDIIKWSIDQCGIVFYDDRKCVFAVKCRGNEFLLGLWRGTGVGVVGNIHDNPELLREVKQ